jgi:hypothetical protein
MRLHSRHPPTPPPPPQAAAALLELGGNAYMRCVQGRWSRGPALAGCRPIDLLPTRAEARGLDDGVRSRDVLVALFASHMTGWQRRRAAIIGEVIEARGWEEPSTRCVLA